MLSHARRGGRCRHRERPAVRGGPRPAALAGGERGDHQRACCPGRTRRAVLELIVEHARRILVGRPGGARAAGRATRGILQVAIAVGHGRRGRTGVWCCPRGLVRGRGAGAPGSRSPAPTSRTTRGSRSGRRGGQGLGPAVAVPMLTERRGVRGVLLLARAERQRAAVHRGRDRAAAGLRRAGGAGHGAGRAAARRRADRAAGGPRPHRPRPARPGHPAAVRHRA